jgi:hypothetical protein
MAHVWTLTDGTTTVTFATGSAGPVIAHQPTIAELDLRESGGGLTLEQKKTVTRTFGILITAASGALLQTQINTIEVLLRQAKERFLTGHGRKLYITQQIDGEASAWRSRVYVGNLRPGEEGYDKWYGLNLECDLRLVCDPFWEGPEVELQLASKASATPATGGKSIHNHDDAGQGNYVQIAAAQVTGTLPAPVRVHLENTSGGALQYARLYMATNAQSDPANFQHIIEVEDTLFNGTPTANAGASDGNYLALTVNTSEVVAIPLPAALVEDCAGRYFRILLYQTFKVTGDTYVSARLSDEDGLSLYASSAGEVKLTATDVSLIADLGSIPIPDTSGDTTGWGPHTLYLSLRSGASVTFAGDFILLAPTESLRHIVQRDYDVANGEFLIDDGIEGVTYRLSGSTKFPNFIANESPIMVWPNMLQRVYIQSDVGISKTMTVRMYHRPRRETV